MQRLVCWICFSLPGFCIVNVAALFTIRTNFEGGFQVFKEKLLVLGFVLGVYRGADAKGAWLESRWPMRRARWILRWAQAGRAVREHPATSTFFLGMEVVLSLLVLAIARTIPFSTNAAEYSLGGLIIIGLLGTTYVVTLRRLEKRRQKQKEEGKILPFRKEAS